MRGLRVGTIGSRVDVAAGDKKPIIHALWTEQHGKPLKLRPYLPTYLNVLLPEQTRQVKLPRTLYLS